MIGFGEEDDGGGGMLGSEGFSGVLVGLTFLGLLRVDRGCQIVGSKCRREARNEEEN